METNPYQPPAGLDTKQTAEQASSVKPKLSRRMYWLCTGPIVAIGGAIVVFLDPADSGDGNLLWVKWAILFVFGPILLLATDYAVIVPFFAEPANLAETSAWRSRLTRSVVTILSALLLCHFLASAFIWLEPFTGGKPDISTIWSCAWPAFALLALSANAFLAAIRGRRSAKWLTAAACSLSIVAFAYDIYFERWQIEIGTFRAGYTGPYRIYYTWWWYDWDLILTNRGH